MISGKDWFESDFLVDAYNHCLHMAKEDEEFEMFRKCDSFKRCIKRKVKEFTWNELEQNQLSEDMLAKFEEEE